MLTVTGAGSVLNALTSLVVGDTSCGCGLIGTLTVADGGVVNSPGFTGIPQGSTLNLGTGGLAGGINTPAIDNEGQIVANFTDTLTLAADISGAGTLSKAGVGTLILTGNNSYAGGTTITGGFINFNSANSFGSGLITINGGGLQWATGNSADISAQLAAFGAGGATFDTNGNNVTLAASLSGPGGLIKTGAGTMTLSGVNSYQGGTAINGGALAVTADANLGAAAGGLAFGGGTLQFLSGFTTNRTVTLSAGGGTFDTNGNNATLAGAIGGAGGLTKVGAGTMTLSGASTYLGGTTVNAGTLQAGATNVFAPVSAFTIAYGATLNLAGFNQTIGSLAGAGAVTLGAATLTTGNDNTSTTFSGAISGTGGLTKTGTGTLLLTGTSNYTGATTVNAGTLSVNGSIASSALTVNAGGTIGGNGTIGNTTINGGTLSPGNSIGTLTVQGNLVLTSAAAYIVEVSPTAADRTNVTGTASLAGTVQAVFGPGAYFARTYTILSAAGGRTGTFGSLTTSGLPAGFTASLSYTATDAILNLTAILGGPSAIGTGGLSINQRNVATSLNTFFNNGGTLPPGFVPIFGLTGGNLGNALSQLSGEAATGGQQVAFQMTNQFLGLMLDPFVDGRTGAAGLSGPAIGFAPEREAVPNEVALAYAAVLKAPPVRRRASSSAGARGAAPMAAATARPAIRRCWAATISPPAPRDLPAASTIALRPTPSWVSRSPAAAPAGAWRTVSAAARATRSRPASTARPAGARPMSRRRCPSPITGCRPTASPLPAIISPPASTRSASARGWRAAIASPPCSAGSRLMPRSRRRTSAPRATARPTSTAAASGSPITAAPAPTPAANSAPASTACWRSTPTRC